MTAAAQGRAGSPADILLRVLDRMEGEGRASSTLGELARRALPLWQLALDRALPSLVHAERPVRCRAGCTACCRPPVPVSIPEALMLRELLERLPPAARDRAIAAFAAARTRLADAGLDEAPLLDRAAHYLALGIDCPFLEDGLCAIHSERPAACREHLVVTPPERCMSLDGGAEAVHFEHSLFSALTGVSAIVAGGAPTTIPLVRLLDWCASEPDLAARRWPLAELRAAVHGA